MVKELYYVKSFLEEKQVLLVSVFDSKEKILSLSEEEYTLYQSQNEALQDEPHIIEI